MKASAKSPVSSFLSAANGLVDRAIGAGDLTAPVRQKLLRQQMGSIRVMIPALMAGSLVVSAILLILTWGTSAFLPVLACVAAINATYGHSVLLSRFGRPRPANAPLGAHAVMRTVGYSALLGLLWGVMLNLLPVAADMTVRSAATIGVGGLLCISMMALVNYPQAMIAFTVPLILGALHSVVGLHSTPDLWVQGVLLTGFALIMVAIAFRHATAFVAHRASETLVEEKAEIIGLLLREFEQSTSDWIWGFDGEGRINRISAGFTTATGVTEAALMDADFVHFLRCVTPPDDPLMVQIEADVAQRLTFRDIDLRVIAGGQECWWSLTGKPAFDEGGTYLGYIGTGSDVTERRLAERRITLLAHHDPMTGLLNRTKFTEQLNQCVARLERYGAPFSVLFLDLDNFKSVNDNHGHIVGDKLLMQVSGRVRETVRETDIAARLGGDEFAVILPNDSAPEGVAVLAERLIAAIRVPYGIDDLTVNIGVSIGIAIAPVNGTQPDEILRNADLALYRAKANGRSVYRFFESQMDSEARERRLMEVELRDAVRNGELVLHYQPLVSAFDAQPTGFEALVRWNHPARGLVPPSEFIPIAEQSSLIVEIGDWTIEQACLAASNWPEHLMVAVNLSTKHFRRSDISMVVQKALAMSGIAPQRLELEVTEGLLQENPDAVADKLHEIHALGITIALDDFGTGYSSLSYLLKFPFDKIKIDRSFVDASTRDPVARDMLKAIASLGKTLKLKITAEGVETQEQAEFLSEIACHQLQGFYFARPLDSIELPHYLLTNVAARAEPLTIESDARLTG